MKTLNIAYSFVRWSTKRQGRDDADSRIRQSKSAEAWCKENGYKLSKQVFIGAGESGFKGKQMTVKDGVAIGALARFIEAIETKSIPLGVLCIDSVDRFSRQEILDALEPFNRLLKLGVGIVFTGSPLKKLMTRELINKEPHWLQFLIQDMVRSWMESAEKSRVIIKAKQRKREQLMNGEIVAHNNVPKYLTFDKDKKVYTHNDNTLIVKRIAKEFLAGSSLYSITKQLNIEGVKTFRYGYQWSAASTRQILKNTVLIGEYLGNKKFNPPILDKDDFDKITKLLDKNSGYNVQGRSGDVTNIFRGLAHCSACDQKMTVIIQKKNYHTNKVHPTPYRYLRCSRHSSGKLCSNRLTMNVDSVEQEFFVNFLMKTPQGLTKTNDEGVKVIERAISIEQTKKTQLEKQIANLTDALAEHGFVQFKDKLTKIQKELNTVTDEMSRLGNELRLRQGAPTDFGSLKSIVGIKNWDTKKFDDATRKVTESLKNEETRKMIRQTLPSIIGKIVCETQSSATNGLFKVYDRSDKLIYTSIDV
jgi:hypothetical protein